MYIILWCLDVARSLSYWCQIVVFLVLSQCHIDVLLTSGLWRCDLWLDSHIFVLFNSILLMLGWCSYEWVILIFVCIHEYLFYLISFSFLYSLICKCTFSSGRNGINICGVWIHISLYVYMSLCMYICLHIFVYTYIHTMYFFEIESRLVLMKLTKMNLKSPIVILCILLPPKIIYLLLFIKIY